MPFNRGDVVLVLFPTMESEIDRVIGRCIDMHVVDSALRHTLGLDRA
jgi:hypothetical protein